MIEEDPHNEEEVIPKSNSSPAPLSPSSSGANDLGPEEIKEKEPEIPDFSKMYYANGDEPSMELVMKYAHLVPEECREDWIQFNTNSFKEHRAFLKHKDWTVHSKSKDNTLKLYSRVSKNNIFCMKSVALVREKMIDLIVALCDNDLKLKYDETVESSQLIYRDLPFESSVSYTKYKKVLVISPRDLIILGRIYKESDKNIYILAKSITLPSIPPVKNIVRAESPCSGWRLKQIDDGDPATGKKPLVKI